MDEHSRALVGRARGQLPRIVELADELYKRVDPGPSGPRPIVLGVVGAGASASAGVPVADELKESFRSSFLGNADYDPLIARLLAEEVKTYPKDRKRSGELTYDDLTLFEAAAVLSRSAYGRKKLREEIDALERKPTHRPLTTELIAHLCKHDFINHLLVLNFDTLIDESILDEMQEGVNARVVGSPFDVPSQAEFRRRSRICYVVRPFGRLRAGKYAITPEDIETFGPEPVRTFLDELAGGGRVDTPPPLVLLLIGYSGSEPAFRRFVHAQLERRRESRSEVKAYVIDIREEIPDGLAKLSQDLGLEVKHIAFGSDAALEILLGVLRHKAMNDFGVWMSAARHRIIAHCFTYNTINEYDKRFIIELLLQGVKSRGFIHLEAFSHVQRLAKFGNDQSRRVIDDLCNEGVLAPVPWVEEEKLPAKEHVPGYAIQTTASVAKYFAEKLGRRRGDGLAPIPEWIVSKEESEYTVSLAEHRGPGTYNYMLKRLEEIERNPEIEIVSDATAESEWELGSHGIKLASLNDLTKNTADLLKEALSGGRAVTIRGIWATGEWLFASSGWAEDERFRFGTRLLELARSARGQLDFKCIVTKPGDVEGGVRKAKREEVLRKLSEHGIREDAVKWLDWWEMNRVLTLISCNGGARRGIYMRRRLTRPQFSWTRI